MSKKYTLEEVRKIFKDVGCKLLSEEYINNFTKLKYKCNCGRISETSLTHFKKGRRCRSCGYEKSSFSLTYSYVKVKKIFDEKNCELLSKKYNGHNFKLKYRCSCGNISKITLGHFSQGQRCVKCSTERIREYLKHSYDYVYNCFLEEKCKLTDKEYINDRIPLKYRCSCGNISKISFNSFQQGRRCKKCGIEKQSGEKHWNYNFNLTDDERELGRNYPKYIEWRKEVYTKDNYICQKCFQRGGRLNAHHIINYSNNKELRLDEKNGITFCKSCHKKFHKNYGIKNNNKKQLKEFLKVEQSYVSN